MLFRSKKTRFTQEPLKEKNWGASLKPLKKSGIFYWLSVFHLLLLYTLTTSAPTWGFTPPPSEDVPKTFTLKGKQITLNSLSNPYKNDPQALNKGGALYTKHCFFCHGDLLDGNGLFGKSFSPPPADFTRLDSILSRPQAYTFWRIMKGGKGLPQKYEPWNSAMPAWEESLSEKDVWKSSPIFIKPQDNGMPNQVNKNPLPWKGENRSIWKNVPIVMAKEAKGMAHQPITPCRNPET